MFAYKSRYRVRTDVDGVIDFQISENRAESIAVLTDVVEGSGSPTVRNAAAIMLAEALNETGRATDAIEVLKKALDGNLK